jgi:hypothetical protein
LRWSETGKESLASRQPVAAPEKVRSFKRAVFALCYPLLRNLGVSTLYRADGSEAAYSPDCILHWPIRRWNFRVNGRKHCNLSDRRCTPRHCRHLSPNLTRSVLQF